VVVWRFASDARVAVLLVALTLGVRPAIGQDVSLEYQVKAAYLYNFVKFVQWPDTARPGPLIICIAGRNPFGTVLAETIRDEVVNGRTLASRTILEPDPACQVLFVPDGAPPAYLRAARGTPTLTVGESPDFLEQGGIINFVKEGPNVRFAISTEAAAEAGLQVSSRLLRLAVNIRGTAP
jgi:hypothetical protein